MDKIIDNLYIGNCFEAIHLFKDKKDFVAVLSIGSEFITDAVYSEYFLGHKSFPHLIFDLWDRSKNITDFIDEGVKFIEDNMKNGDVFVHCAAGVSRSPAMVYAYFIHKGLDPIKAFELLTSTRTCAKPYKGFIKDILRHYKIPNNEIDKTLNYIKSGLSND